MLIPDWNNSIRAIAPPALVVLGLLVVAPWAPLAARSQQGAATATSLPAKLSDADFWKLTSDISEPGGYFQIADNFTSNEGEIGQLMTMIGERGLTGGVYLGVGPEQNFSYIAAIHPAMAFIVDIRRQAVMQHLMFKAMFEMAKDRADFLSLLFAKPRPKDLDATTSIQKMWDAYLATPTDPGAAASIRDRVVQRLTRTQKFTFTADEQAQLDSVIAAFVQFGPGITTKGSLAGRGGGNTWTFADLTGWSLDAMGRPQSLMSTEENFQVVKALHDKNLIVAVSGDFGGPKALRAIGAYVRNHGNTVTAFYVSNVEQYLFQDNKQLTFYDNVAALPLTDASVFIRPYALRRPGPAPGLCGIRGFLKSIPTGRVASNNDALACIGSVRSVGSSGSQVR
jgi:hypothetical protein